MSKIDRRIKILKKELRKFRSLELQRYDCGKKRPSPRHEYRKFVALKAYSLVHYVLTENLIRQFKSYCHNNMPASLPSENASPFNLGIRILECDALRVELNITQSSNLERWGKGLLYAYLNNVTVHEFKQYLQETGITELFRQYQNSGTQSHAGRSGVARRNRVRAHNKWIEKRDKFLELWLDG